MGKSGRGLGIFALLLAFGAIGLSAYLLIFAQPSASPPEGPTIYTDTRYDSFYLDAVTYELIPDLQVNYSTEAGDSVLLEFSCQVDVGSIGTLTIDFFFEVDSFPLTPYTTISIRKSNPTDSLRTSCIMRHTIQNSSAGTHIAEILTYINVGSTDSRVSYNILTVTVF